MPERRLAEAIKQAEIVAATAHLSPRTHRDLRAAIHGLAMAQARYERNRDADRDRGGGADEA